MDNSKRGTIPMQERLDLNKSQGAQTPKEVNRMKNVPYASAVGSIMYAVRCTRPDVAFAQNITSRFQQNPGELHWTAVKNILKYLRNTKDMFLVYGGNPSTELRVECYCNAGFEIDINDMKSLTGYVSWLFVTEEDIKSLPRFLEETLIAIKAPHGTILEVPDPDEAVDYPQRRYRIVPRITMGPIDVYLVSQFEEKHEEINHVEANSSIPSTSEMIEIQVQK
ncbi:retrotransposon protein, putative, ty1-copia subclass [Tanacetum coccineum]